MVNSLSQFQIKEAFLVHNLKPPVEYDAGLYFSNENHCSIRADSGCLGFLGCLIILLSHLSFQFQNGKFWVQLLLLILHSKNQTSVNSYRRTFKNSSSVQVLLSVARVQTLTSLSSPQLVLQQEPTSRQARSSIIKKQTTNCNRKGKLSVPKISVQNSIPPIENEVVVNLSCSNLELETLFLSLTRSRSVSQNQEEKRKKKLK